MLSNHVVRQYRAFVVDVLGLGIHMCGVYYSIMRTTHPDVVCLLFVPSLYSTFYFLLVLSVVMLSNDSRGYSVY